MIATNAALSRVIVESNPQDGKSFFYFAMSRFSSKSILKAIFGQFFMNLCVDS